MTEQKIERINYNGKEYFIKDLTDEMKQEMNLLLSIQTELDRLGKLVKTQQRAQEKTTSVLNNLIEEADIKEAPPVTTVADTQLEKAHDMIDEANESTS
jgi:NADPH:quinone reductase-like Zn-dependent oxidoreductase|tara:strand:+ start:1728 stop:2024 length:297 start_codon:yes stop_codon:yes gene_type:complete